MAQFITGPQVIILNSYIVRYSDDEAAAKTKREKKGSKASIAPIVMRKSSCRSDRDAKASRSIDNRRKSESTLRGADAPAMRTRSKSGGKNHLSLNLDDGLEERK